MPCPVCGKLASRKTSRGVLDAPYFDEKGKLDYHLDVCDRCYEKSLANTRPKRSKADEELLAYIKRIEAKQQVRKGGSWQILQTMR